jgi:antitoxin HicB
MDYLDSYPFEIEALSKEEGGGFFISYPDFDVCISDGATLEEAILNGREALIETIATLREFGHPVPLPGSKQKLTG